MKLATYDTGAGAAVAIVTSQGLVDLSAALPALAPTMAHLIASWGVAEAEVRRIEASATSFLPLAKTRLLAPIARPGKVLAIGLNYKDHIAESGLATPEHQLWFAKQPTTINGPFDPIEIPRASPGSVDYEAELVAVIGRAGRHISRDRAQSHVFGYCCGNDVSVREWQRHTPQWMLGKSFDTHAPIGPWIVTADEIPDPHALDISCSVNGTVRQQSNTRHLLFDVFDQIAHLSKAMTLEPADIVFTGTPGGVGAAMKPPSFLQPDDRVRVEIAGIGAIEGVMRAEE